MCKCEGCIVLRGQEGHADKDQACTGIKRSQQKLSPPDSIYNKEGRNNGLQNKIVRDGCLTVCF